MEGKLKHEIQTRGKKLLQNTKKRERTTSRRREHSVHLTNAGPHIHGGHESVVAETAVLSGDVGTLTPVTDIRAVLALIDVWTGERTSVTVCFYTILRVYVQHTGGLRYCVTYQRRF